MCSEEVPTRVYLSAFTIGMDYLVGGTILNPLLFHPKGTQYAHLLLVITGIVLLTFGAVKARVTGAAGKRAGGYIWGAICTLAVSGAAAAATYGMVYLPS
jgi:VIT1/CCC1 family predicted Fe2+/Mn2+ transporter